MVAISHARDGECGFTKKPFTKAISVAVGRDRRGQPQQNALRRSAELETSPEAEAQIRWTTGAAFLGCAPI